MIFPDPARPLAEPGRRLRVRHLLGVGELTGAELIGGHDGLDREITEVAVLHGTGDTEAVGQGTLVITASRAVAGYELEVLIRAAHSKGAVAVVVLGQIRILRSTRQMADRRDLPVIVVPTGEPVQLATRLAAHVLEPTRLAVQRALQVLNRLPGAPTSTEQILQPLRESLQAPVVLLGRDRTVLAGSADFTLADVELPSYAQVIPAGHGHQVLAPVFVDDPVRPDLWLGTQLPASHQVWLDGVAQLLKVAAFPIAALTARERIRGEQDARDRSTLLAELMDATQALGRHTVQRALHVGWRLDGWHTGVYLQLELGIEHAPDSTAALARALRAQGLVGVLAERSDGWVFWFTDDAEPPSTTFRSTRLAVAHAVESLRDRLPLIAGVGRPYEGHTGIGRTVREAREACLFAGMTSRRSPVEHIDELGARRILARWHESEAFSSYARTVLAPLLGGEDVLLDTLQVYLDRESSASAAASFLGVHRNTVNQRVERAERALGVDLSRPDDRLVIQLACRVVRGSEQARLPS
ncbi:helix-turn-helix domain-containing protein [Pseudonocardia hispaniensis]|uniref:Helix-turn-helix domain-containing protein n=1 Tax=Pseudonocardia hispaniensis TaxID=904933 RepID=A0ABW1J1H6_9PSEU